MKRINSLLLPPVFLAGAGVLLSGCQSPITDNSSRNVNITSSAVFVAQRDGNKPWVVAQEGNVGYDPNVSSLLVENSSKRFSVLMVCPATSKDVPHKVYIYLATVPELPNINHTCRKSQFAIDRKSVYGLVRGVDVNSNQKARLALGENRGEWAYEAYAFEDVAGMYDLLGYAGTGDISGSFNIEKYFRYRGVQLDNPPPRIDVDFSTLASTTTYTTQIPDSANATATVVGVPDNVNWVSRVSFRTETRTYLTLAEGQTASLPYKGIPIYISGSNDIGFQRAGEGHEFQARILDASNRVTSGVTHYFKNPHDITINLAAAVLSTELVELVPEEVGRSVLASWGLTQDALHGGADLFHWVFQGNAEQSKSCSICGGVKSEFLEWHVLATPGWLGGQESMRFNLPAIDEGISDTKRWWAAWNFADTELTWSVTAYYADIDENVVKNDNAIMNNGPIENYTGVEALLAHLFNRQYINGLNYVQLSKYSP